MTNNITVEYRSVTQLIPYARNARTHSDEQVAKIAASIREFGWTSPILVDGDNGIIAGHGRLAAARKLGLDQVPVIELAHLTPAQKRAYVIADNKLALDAGWDSPMLESELLDLAADGFDLSLTGHDMAEIADVIGGDTPERDIEVKKVETSIVNDQFWISVRGPLVHQAKALSRLLDLMADMPVDVELGTTKNE